MNDTPSSLHVEGPVCPLPISHHEVIVMGHGSGGKMSHDLVRTLFLPLFQNPILAAGNDAGVTPADFCQQDGQPVRLAISTDSHVVFPLFFPGGDIGRLAVCGTVNDIAMMGASPLYLTAGFVLEEGLPIATLEQIVASMKAAAQQAGVHIVAGDTKVVQKGKADGLYITTSGIGIVQSGIQIGGEQARPGDIVILSGPVGDHGIAVLSARGELGFETGVLSDVAPLNHLVQAMLAVASQGIHVLRDPTRGGLATTLNEIVQQSQVGMQVYEEKIPVRPAVQAACEMLGFDPLYVANEGKLVAIVHPSKADQVLSVMRRTPYGEEAVIIGEIVSQPPGRVLLRTPLGSTRILDVLAGEMLPRIC